MKRLFIVIFAVMLLFGCLGKNEQPPMAPASMEYKTFSQGSFSVKYPSWQEQAPGDNLLMVSKNGCSASIKDENFVYMPRAFRFRAKTIELALESLGLSVQKMEIGEQSAILAYTAPDLHYGKIRLIPCEGKIYWASVDCPKGGNESFFGAVLDSAACSSPPVWAEEQCPASDLGFQKRPFYLAMTLSPGYKTDQSWLLAMERLPEAGDTLLWMFIPKWEDFLPGRIPSANVSNEIKVMNAYADAQGIELAIGLDPTSGMNRSRLYELSPGRETTFSDPDFRQAYKNAAVYYAGEMKPKYMALSIEINMYYLGNEQDFENYVSLYKETYDNVKNVSPDTKVFATIQLEDIQGMWSWHKHDPQWFIISKLEPKMDLLVLSTYPSLVYSAPSQIPADYLTRVKNYTNLTIAIGETGYNSGKGIVMDKGSEEKQKEYLTWLLKNAEEMNMEFVTWITLYDPEWEGFPQELVPFKDMGLRYANDSRKEAWCVMKNAMSISKHFCCY